MCPGICHPLTAVFLVRPLLCGGEFCSSAGTTSNSDEVPCAERDLGAAWEKNSSPLLGEPTGESSRAGQRWKGKISSHIQVTRAAPPCRAELPGFYTSVHWNREAGFPASLPAAHSL